MRTAIIVPTHNGGEQLRECLESIVDLLEGNDIRIGVVDNGSDDLTTLGILKEVSMWDNVKVIRNEESKYTLGALKQVFWKIKADRYLLIHDSVTIKSSDCLLVLEDKLKESDIVAWLTFPFMFDNHEQEGWVWEAYKMNDRDIAQMPTDGIFGSILYTSKEVLLKYQEAGYLRMEVKNKNQECGMERGWSLGATNLGLKLSAIHPGEWSNDRIDRDDYTLFTKKLLHRL